ncbi:hypothetical protein MPSEU_000618900 [Mayamaea pseudoterrestris]|nr:hypothetical protein MPSEU_000618900 [Mayamaea pseudoterrestris]
MAEASLAPSTIATTVATATTKATASPSASSILRAPLTKDDLEFELQDDQFLIDFEKAWARFLRKHPNCMNIPRHSKMMDLEQKLEASMLSKTKVEVEIEQQMAFFASSCEQLEDEYAAKMQQAIDRQAAVQDELAKRIAVVNEADVLQQETLPWHYFMHQLDTLASKAIMPQQIKDMMDEASVTSNGLNVKPSNRALLLTNYDLERHSRDDLMLRAHATDNAILSAHIQMLGTEMQRYDKATQAQELASKFLTDYNVWSILNAGQPKAEAAAAPLADLTKLSPSAVTSMTESNMM